MVTPLEQFRAQYPSAALVSDLVSTQDGQYVVRTAIVQKGETLATGLSASVDVQIAEDRARDRAIALLGITSGTTTPAVSTNGTTTTAKDPAKDKTAAAPSVPAAAPAPAPKVVSKSKSVPVSPAAPAQPSSPPKPSAKKQSTAATPAASTKPSSKTSVQTDIATLEPDTELQFEPEEVPPMSPEEDLGPPIDAIEEAPTASDVPSKPSAAAIALENLSTSSSPVDLSDVIAQTDVELTRLGWTSAQGREYLESTYGKRSRQQLTDEELMSFLLYLEDQS